MKKSILLLSLGFVTLAAAAQTSKTAVKAAATKVAPKMEVAAPVTMAAGTVDAHAGHNHGAEVKQDAKPAPEGIKFSTDQHSFGKIPQGKPVTHVFKVTNISGAPYKLDNVQASCGCTTPTWDKEKTLAPGETMEITVGYNAASEGPFTKPVTVTYNGTQSKMFTITGEVWKTPTDAAPLNNAAEVIKP
jgi:hypothetical protein